MTSTAPAARRPQRIPLVLAVSATLAAGTAVSAANHTSAFNCRKSTGSATSWSRHAYGMAIDINPVENPYVTRSGRVDPIAGKAFTNRARPRPGMLTPGSAGVKAFTAAGWKWGGAWTSAKDYQHFSNDGR